MAEGVKRRVAAARLAVAFAAAGTIAGATAWARAGPPPPTASESALNSYLKLKLDSTNTKNGSLRFRDFHKGEIPSLDRFRKLQGTTERFKKVASRTFATESDLGAIKSELGGYIKMSEADSRYLKQSDPVVHGDGSVFSESRSIPAFAGKRDPVMGVPGLLTIEAENGKPPLFYVVNQTGAPPSHTACGGGGGGSIIGGSPAGVTQPGQHFHCPAGVEPATVQLFGEGPDPIVASLTVSAIPVGQTGDAQYTVQILVGT
jgi:hypothetical protein